MEPPLGVGETYDVRVRFIGNRVVNFLLVLIELFSLDDTTEALWLKIDIKSAGGPVSAKFSHRKRYPHQFCTDS